MRALSLSSKGDKSEKNEDASLVLASRGLFVIADGVGGGPSGDFASRTLVDDIYETCSQAEVTEQLLERAIQSANEKIFSAAQSPELNGMATTVACALVQDNKLITMHVGDSRIYRVRNSHIERLTEDHTKLIKKSDDQEKHVVTNAIGLRKHVKIEAGYHDMAEGDALLLVTDGISDAVNDELISKILLDESKSLSDRLNDLIGTSEELGGRDDKTVVFVKSC